MTRLELLIRFLAPLTYLWLCVFIPSLESIVYIGVVLAALCFTLWMNSFDQRQRGGFPFTLGFAYPLPVFWLVALPMAWLLISNILIYLSIVMVARVIFGLSFPAFTMVLFLGTATTCLATATWASSKMLERALLVVSFCVGLIWWISPRLVLFDPLVAGPDAWTGVLRFSYEEQIQMVIVSTVAFCFSVFYVWRQRCGETDSTFGELFRFASLDCFERRASRGFSTSFRAQVWFELRRVGRRAAITTFAGLLFMFLASWLLAESNGVDAYSSLLVFFLLSSVTLLISTTEGVLGMKYRGRVLRLSVYEATQPVTIGGSTLMKLGIVVGITLMGSAVLAVGGVGCSVLLGGIDEVLSKLSNLEHVRSFEAFLWGVGLVLAVPVYVVLCMVAALLAMIVGYSAPWVERNRAVLIPFILVLILPVFTNVVEAFSGWDLRVVDGLYSLLWGTFLLFAVFAGVKQALRAGFLRSLGVGAAVVVVTFFFFYIVLAGAFGGREILGHRRLCDRLRVGRASHTDWQFGVGSPRTGCAAESVGN